mmetsp:Transcript_36606/g.97624  ORF Transcript_36606/g.97624 Transcript_36606/m.97624 type:complete len:359 (-) Transcript_36606:4-1080(-)
MHRMVFLLQAPIRGPELHELFPAVVAVGDLQQDVAIATRVLRSKLHEPVIGDSLVHCRKSAAQFCQLFALPTLGFLKCTPVIAFMLSKPHHALKRALQLFAHPLLLCLEVIDQHCDSLVHFCVLFPERPVQVALDAGLQQCHTLHIVCPQVPPAGFFKQILLEILKPGFQTLGQVVKLHLQRQLLSFILVPATEDRRSGPRTDLLNLRFHFTVHRTHHTLRDVIQCVQEAALFLLHHTELQVNSAHFVDDVMAKVAHRGLHLHGGEVPMRRRVLLSFKASAQCSVVVTCLGHPALQLLQDSYIRVTKLRRAFDIMAGPVLHSRTCSRFQVRQVISRQGRHNGTSNNLARFLVNQGITQ